MGKLNRFAYNVSKYTAEEKFTLATWLFIKRVFGKVTKFINKCFAQLVRNNLSRKTKIDENKILFITFQGDYTCNPKYITEEMIKRGLYENLDIVWAGRAGSIKKIGAFPSVVRTVDLYSYEMMKEVASAKVVVCNSVEYHKRRLPIKPGQKVIQTWHGSFGIKRFDRDHNAGKAWVKAADYNGKVASYCVSNSLFENDVYRGSFWPKTEILEVGHPRNDLLIGKIDHDKQEIIERIKESYDIPKDSKIILYGPTFRDSHKFDCYNIEPELILDTLSQKFGGEWTLLTRYHPTVRKKRNINNADPRIKDASSYPDIQELMLVADIAITDYSSWIYDFVLTRKPGFIFATDIEMYNNERGFYYPLESTPFPVATSAYELAEKIMSFDNEQYLNDVETFLEGKGSFEKGLASSKVVDKILEIMGK